MGTSANEIVGWYRSTPVRRPAVEREVPVPQKPPVTKNLFHGIFRRKMAENYLNSVHDRLEDLDQVLANENFQAVRAAHFQLAVEAMMRLGRADLLREFEKARDEAILEARSVKPLRNYAVRNARLRGEKPAG